jgi:hypothetical protein
MTVTKVQNKNLNIDNAPDQYTGIVGDTKPTDVPTGSLYFESAADYSSTTIYITPDGTNWSPLP